MAHFAELNSDNVVLRTVRINNDVIGNAEGLLGEELGISFCKSLYGNETIWKQTSYNDNFRGNYASTGMIYDLLKDAFYIPNPPFSSWKLNQSTFKWEAPTSYPTDDKLYIWDEITNAWVLDTTRVTAVLHNNLIDKLNK
jgi:hypothetical protein